VQNAQFVAQLETQFVSAPRRANRLDHERARLGRLRVARQALKFAREFRLATAACRH
jgi:hypothetical protein